MERTRANGPGVRLGIWVQGCSRNCPGCINPETHDISQGEELYTYEILSIILANEKNIEGISISGGEPLDQSEELLELLLQIRNKTELPVILWTGYPRNGLEQIISVEKLSKLVDLMIIGPYIEEFHEPIGLKGSSNQEYIFFSKKYNEQDLLEVPSAEVIFVGGEMQISGIDTEQIRSWFR
jgi:anaerobic ribonucleoside-triphosphate reductase activating protein